MKNLENGVTEIRYSSLVYAITNLQGYKKGKSSMQEYYFPIRSLSEAINSTELDNYIEYGEEKNTLIF